MLISLGRPLPKGAGHVSQWFGEHPEWYKRWNLAGHNALDYACAVGTPVLAAHDGVLERRAFDKDGYGLYVIVRGEDYDTLYAHLSDVCLADKSLVKCGERIALSGNTGNSTGPHLHWSLSVHGMSNQAYGGKIDPSPFRDI